MEALRRVELFSGLDTDQLAELAGKLRGKRCAAGQVICLRGDPGNSLYLIRSGRVRVVLTSPAGKEVVLNLLGAGDFVGDLALLDGAPRSADVIAHDDCELLALDRSDFMAFLDTHPAAAKHLLAVMSKRLRHNADLIEEVAFLDIGARLARLLLALASERGQRHGDEIVIGNLSQSDLAGMISATRESVNKWLAAYRRRGLVEWRQGRLVILQPKRLDRLAEVS
jgi:CRP-like cAMP-binding protein